MWHEVIKFVIYQRLRKYFQCNIQFLFGSPDTLTFIGIESVNVYDVIFRLMANNI